MQTLKILAAARRRTVLIAGAAALTLSTLAGPVQAQQAWPSKPIKLWVGFPPGGGIDAVARNLQPGLEQALGQQVIVEYKPGAGGVLAATELTHAPADGYTILVANIGPFVLVPNMVSKKPYDPQKDFTYIAQTSGSGFIAAVPANHPANTLAGFIEWAKANPGKANFASGGAGAITHLNGELLNQVAGTKLVHVPYKGSAPAVQDLIGGQTALLVDVATVLLPHIDNGRLKALYVTDEQRSAALPNVPTAREAGYPGLTTSGWQGIVGPAGIPQEIVERLSKAIHETLAKPEVRQKFAANGSSIMERGPKEFKAFIDDEFGRWVPVIKASGAKLD